MPSEAAVPLAVGAACYGAALLLSPSPRGGRRLSTAGALGPALLVVSLAGQPPHGPTVPLWAVVAAACAAEAVAFLVTGRLPAPLVVAWHAALLAVCGLALEAMMSRWGGPFWQLSPPRQAGLATVASLLFVAGELVRRSLFTAARESVALPTVLIHEARELAPAALVFASASGLVVLSYRELRLAAFPATLLPLWVTYRGFERFAKARRTYVQTILALGQLTEEAGYATAGHHRRVAHLAVATARELGLWGERLRRLELVALLHDVGAVSVPDPEDLPRCDRFGIAAAGARVLEETGYLAPQARLLTQAASSPSGTYPVDARILRVASDYDDLLTAVGGGDRAAWAYQWLRATAAPEDRRVVEALGRALVRSGQLPPAACSGPHASR